LPCILWAKQHQGDTKMNFLKNKKVRNWVIAIALAAAAVMVGSMVSPANAGDLAAEAAADVVSINIAQTVEASGTLEAQPFARLSWKTGGIVQKVNVQAGDQVHAGDILVELQPASTTAAIASAQADLVTAQKNLEDLLASNTDFAQAAIDLKELREEYQDAADYLDYLRNDRRVPQTETKLILHSTPKGYQYEYKTRSFKGPATEDMLIEAENDLALKQARYEDARRRYDRLKDGPNAQDVRAAQARVDAAQAAVNSLSIIAPFDGQVLSVDDQAGDTVTSGELSVNMADMSRLYIRTQVDESDIANIKLGNQAEVTLDALPGLILIGRVAQINPVGESIAGLVKYSVRIDLDEDRGDIFLPLGATANVVIQVRDASASLAVPITAIQNDSSGEFVWLLQPDGSSRRVDVVSGSIVGELVVVTGELGEGDQVQLVARESGFQPPNPFGGNK
jgi:HlyD family secretion protein